MFIFSQFLVAVFFYRQVLSIIIIFLAFKRSDDKRQMASLLRKFYLKMAFILDVSRKTVAHSVVWGKFLGFFEMI